MARLLFKPVSIVSSIFAGKLAAKLFNAIWSKVDRKDGAQSLSPTARDASFRRAATANMVQAATYAGTHAAIDRARVRAIYHFTGLWTGDKPKKPEETPDEAATAA